MEAVPESVPVGVMPVGRMTQLEWDGAPLQVNPTHPLNPPRGPTLMVKAADCPAVMEVGDAERVTVGTGAVVSPV